LQVGDVVAFDAGGKAISHRIMGREAKGWVTRGDGCPGRDGELLTPERLIGKVMERERAGARDTVTGGRRGLRRARRLHGAARLRRICFRVLAPPYRLLRASHLVAALWRPRIVKARFAGPEGVLIKRIHRGRTVACWSPQDQRWDCRKPYDLVLESGRRVAGAMNGETQRMTTFSTQPEMSLLCACVSPVGTPALVDGRFERRLVDWSRFVTLATDHHVIPLAYRALKGNASLPDEVRARLRRDSMTIAAYGLRAAGVLRRLQRALGSQNIQVVPIKGPALAALAYGSATMRQFEDLDLIVRHTDLLKAVELLESAGHTAPGVPRTAYRHHAASLQAWSFYKPGDPLRLEFKPVLIAHTLCRTPSAEFMAGACRPLDMGDGATLSAPGAEAMLLAVCVDGAKDMWDKLSLVADVGRLLAAWPAADWAGLIRDATTLGQRRSLLTGVQVAAMLTRCPLPDVLHQAVHTDKAAQRLARMAARHLLAGQKISGGAQGWYAVRTRDRLRDRCRYLARTLFVPGSFELCALPLPRCLFPLYKLARPLRLTWDVVIRRGRDRRLSATAYAVAPLAPGRGAT